MSARLKLAVTAAKGLVPRMVFGNYAGVSNNVGPKRELARLQRSYRQAVPLNGHVADAIAADAAFLREQGYLVLRQPIDRALMEPIQQQYRAVIEDPRYSTAPSTPVPTYRSLVDPMRHMPGLRFLITEDIRRMLVAHYGCHFRIKHVRAWRTYHVPNVALGQEVYSNTWHTDQFPVTSLRLFVYLSDDVTRETGAFQFQPRPETEEIVRSPGYLSRAWIYGRARALAQDPSRVRYLEGGLGSACFCNVQLCLHRAGVPKAGALRDIAQFYIEPADVPLPHNWYEQLPPDSAAM